MTDDFLDNLSQPRPDPGGGAAAAHGGLVALALMEKVARLEAGRRNRAEQRELWVDLLAQVRALRDELAFLRERDTTAYLQLAEARRSEPQGQDLARALSEAIHCPLMMMKAVLQAAEQLSLMGTHCSSHLLADLQVAAEFLTATLRGAYHIAMANVDPAADYASGLHDAEEVTELLGAAKKRFQEVRERLGMSSILRCP